MNGNIIGKLKCIVLCLFAGLLMATLFVNYAIADGSHNTTVVKVGYYENENFQEGASDGAAKSGYCYEYLQKIASYNGWKYKYVYGSWSDLYASFVKGDIDILAGLGYSEGRLSYMNYPNLPMGYEAYYLFVRGDDNSISIDAPTLNGKRIGTIPGLLEDALKEWLNARDIKAEVVLFDDVTDRDKALTTGKIDAFIGEGASVSSKDNIIPLVKIKNADMYLCVAKNRTDLLYELNEALDELDTKEPYYINDLSKKYFANNVINRHVSAEEEAWLESHNYTITVGYMDDFLPYCGTDKNGNATGIMVDVLNEGFANLTANQPIKFEFRAYTSTVEMIQATHNHEIEVMFPISDDIYYLENNELYHSVNVITSAMNLVFKDNPSKIEGGVFAVNRNNQIQYNYVANYYPDNKVAYYDNVNECLMAVAKGEADGAILSGLRASSLLNEDAFSELSYMELPYLTVKCFGVGTTHKGILPLINQALNSLEENEALTYTFKYISNNDDYSISAFFKRYRALAIFVLMMLVIATVVIVANNIVQAQKQKMYFQYAYIDGLTKLFNRRAYEEELHKLNQNLPDNLICVSMDLTGLKKANDTFGHAAGDELISEAARLIKETFGKYGKIFRTGGDEYYGLILTDNETYNKEKESLDNLCNNWKGAYGGEIRIAIGAATAGDAESSEIMNICKLADKRMYEAKSAWYKTQGIDRRGRDSAHAALANMYTKILKINITDDTYLVVSSSEKELISEMGFSSKISKWLCDFGKTGQVHPEDLEQYLKLTDIDFLKTHFRQERTPVSICYRRNYGGEFKPVIMEIIPADDYSDDNQTLFLYVKATNIAE